MNQKWTKLSFENFVGRYEHCAHLSANKVYVFGGANKVGSLNSIQVVDIGLYFSLHFIYIFYH